MTKDPEQVYPTTTLESEVQSASAAPEKTPMKGVDDALHYASTRGAVAEWTPEEERRVLRKIDSRLLPMMFFASLLLYMDSQGFGIAAIFNMIQDLGLYDIVSLSPLTLSTVKYSWASSIPAFGLLISQYPLLILAQRSPLGKFTAATVLWTGFFALMMIVCHDFVGTMIVRFLYGFQSIGTPVNIFVCAMWWKNDEQPLRIGIFSSGAAIGGVVGQAFDMGALSIKGPYENSPWKYIYVLLGAFSIAYGILLIFIFPDSPMKARFLNERERDIAVLRVQKNNTGIQTRQFKIKQAIECLRDPQMYLLAVVFFTLAFANSVIGSFGGLLVTSFSGVGTFRALQLLMPASGVIFVIMVLSGYLAKIFPKHRIAIAIAHIIPSIVGNVLLWKMPRDNVAALMGGLYICVLFYGSYIQMLGLLSSNIAGHSKKTTMNSLVFITGCVGGIVGPFAFKGEEAVQGYPTGIIAVLSLMAFSELCLVLLYIHYRRANARKVAFLQGTAAPASEEDMAFLDLTDMENIHFRYTY